MRQITEIIVHCSATRPEWMAGKSVNDKAAEIRRWHVDGNRWRDIGYHYVIDRDGSGAQGRPDEVVGAHVRGRNKNSIGVCLIGGHGSSENDRFADHFTPEQDASLRATIKALRAKYGPLKVFGHNQFAAKACPGFHAPDWFEGAAVQRAAYVPPEVTDLIEEAKGGGADSKSILAKVGETGVAGGAAAMTAFGGLDQKVALGVIVGVVVLGSIYIITSRRRKNAKARAAEASLGVR